MNNRKPMPTECIFDLKEETWDDIRSLYNSGFDVWVPKSMCSQHIDFSKKIRLHGDLYELLLIGTIQGGKFDIFIAWIKRVLHKNDKIFAVPQHAKMISFESLILNCDKETAKSLLFHAHLIK